MAIDVESGLTVSGGDARVVGRDAELRQAEEFLDVIDRRFTALVVEGEAGIGKTTIWLEVIRRADERGFRVLSARPALSETKLSLSTIADLVDEIPCEALASLARPQRRALEVALLRVDPGEGRLEPREVATAFRSLLRLLADAGPLLLAVDDEQWLDSASARVLAFALRRLGGVSMGCLLSRRAAEPTVLDEVVANDAVRRLPIGPLGVAALHRVLTDRLGRPLTRPMLTRIHRICGGNPLFALEIARELSARGADGSDQHLPVPEDLRGLIVGRVRDLPANSQDALLVCAAAAVPTTSLVDEHALAAAEDGGLLTIHDTGQVAFCHPLYASAVYGSAPRRRRREVHRRLADMVTDREERARHLALAAAGPDEQVALALERGAQAARSRGAWESAAELLEHAARLTPDDRAHDRHRRRIIAAEHHGHAGDRSRARTLLEATLATGLPRSLSAEALRLLAETAYHDENPLEARRLFVDALECADDRRTAAACEFGLAFVDSCLLDFPSGAVHAYRSLQHAEALGERQAMAEALALCVMMDFLCGRGADWQKLHRSLALEDTAAVVPLHRRPSQIAALLMLYLGRHAEARQLLAALCEQTRECGDESDLAFVLVWFSWLETRSGDLARAQQLAEEGVYLAGLTGSRSMLPWLVTQQAYVAAHRGDVGLVRQLCAEAEPLVASYGNRLPLLWVAASRALVELSIGNADAAWQACEPLLRAVEAHGIGEPIPMFFLPDALEALILTDHLSRAEALIDALGRRGKELGREWALAVAHRCRGLLLAASGDVTGALESFEDALAQHDRMEMPFARARTLLAKGKVERRARKRARAKVSLGEARDLFDQLGARLFGEQALAELNRVGLRRSGFGELTETEHRVAELAAAGHTNREIAAALFISPKTVEANLARAYHKLGVASRAQLGARMAAPLAVEHAGPQT